MRKILFLCVIAISALVVSGQCIAVEMAMDKYDGSVKIHKEMARANFFNIVFPKSVSIFV